MRSSRVRLGLPRPVENSPARHNPACRFSSLANPIFRTGGARDRATLGAIAVFRRSARGMEFLIITRRLICDVLQIFRRIFAESFGEAVWADPSRRTARVAGLCTNWTLLLVERPAALLPLRLVLPVSNVTLLRVIRRRTRAPTETLSVVGIDDSQRGVFGEGSDVFLTSCFGEEFDESGDIDASIFTLPPRQSHK